MGGFVAPALVAAGLGVGGGALYISKHHQDKKQQDPTGEHALPMFGKNSQDKGGEGFQPQLAI